MGTKIEGLYIQERNNLEFPDGKPPVDPETGSIPDSPAQTSRLRKLTGTVLLHNPIARALGDRIQSQVLPSKLLRSLADSLPPGPQAESFRELDKGLRTINSI